MDPKLPTNALAQAKHHAEQSEQIYLDRPSREAPHTLMAHAYAAIAQAEAARPRFVRLGDQTINLAHIAYVSWDKTDRDGDRYIQVSFIAAGSNTVMGLNFYGEEAEVVDKALHDALDQYTVVAVDFPEEVDPAKSEASPFTFVE